MPPNLELWLVRHGETTANAQGRLSGWSDVPLTSLGEAQASALRPILEGMEFTGVWSSDLLRAVSTAHLAYAGEPIVDPRLREIGFGDLEGVVWSTIEERQRDAIMEFDSYAAPGGESLADLLARILDFVGSLEPGRHLIFSHGGAIRLLTNTIGHDNFLKNGGLIAVDWTARKILRVEIPEAHLTAESRY